MNKAKSALLVLCLLLVIVLATVGQSTPPHAVHADAPTPTPTGQGSPCEGDPGTC